MYDLSCGLSCDVNNHGVEVKLLGGSSDLVSGLVHPSYKSTNPSYNQGWFTHLRFVGSSPPSREKDQTLARRELVRRGRGSGSEAPKGAVPGSRIGSGASLHTIIDYICG